MAIKPDIRLGSLSSDECNLCTDLKNLLSDPNLTDTQREELNAIFEDHKDMYVTQREGFRALTVKIKEQLKNYAIVCASKMMNGEDPHVIARSIGVDNLPEFVDSPVNSEIEVSQQSLMKVCCEDFAGNTMLPFFAHHQPNIAFYASNLVINRFVLCNLTENSNEVIIYDERTMGKDGDALCSLRLSSHLRSFVARRDVSLPQYQVYTGLYDNCVGQNKSQANFKFNAMLSLLFYKRVVLHFLISGHSRMPADRVTALCNQSMKKFTSKDSDIGTDFRSNLYLPEHLTAAFDSVNTVNSIFIDHRDPQRPVYENWEKLFGGLQNISSKVGFTKYYFFEFENGILTMRRNIDSPLEESVQHVYCEDPEETRKQLMRDLFNATDMNEVNIDSVSLSILKRAPAVELTASKIVSMSKKLSMIPSKYLHYYPDMASVTNARKSLSKEELAEIEDPDDPAPPKLSRKPKEASYKLQLSGITQARFEALKKKTDASKPSALKLLPG